MSTYTVVVVVVYLLIIAYLGYLGYKGTKTSTDYLLAGRNSHPLIMALSYGATFISTSAIVGFGGTAANLGMGLLWLTFLNIFIGIFIAFIFFGKRTRKMGCTLDAHTFPELLGRRFNSKFIQGFAGAIIFVFMPIYAAAVIKGGANFIEEYFGVSYRFALLFFVVIVAVYVYMGGLKGVMYTDAFQGGVMFIAMIILLIVAYKSLGGVASAHKQLTDLFTNPDIQGDIAKNIKGGFQGWTSMPKFNSSIWWTVVSTIVMGVGVGVLTQPQLVVRYMTVKSDKELNRAVLSGGIFILAMTGVAFVVGALSNVLLFNKFGKIAIVAAGGVNDKIIPMFIKNYIPEWFGAIFLVAMLAAAMSTLSSQFHAMGSAAGRDVYEKGLGKKGNSLVITKTAILIVIVISTILAWLSSYLDVSDAIIAKGTSLFFGLTAAAFLPVYFGTLYIKTLPKAAAIWGMVSGFAVSFFFNFFIHKNAESLQLCKLLTGKTTLVDKTSKLLVIDPLFIALPVSIVVTLVIWGIFKYNKKQDVDKEHIEKCFIGM
jgi:solute:Na+ symporter, SSS family